MDVMSTARTASQTPITNQKPTNYIANPQIPPDDANLKAITEEMKQIANKMKEDSNSQLAPLRKDTANFANSQEARIIDSTIPANPIENKPEETVKTNTPAA